MTDPGYQAVSTCTGSHGRPRVASSVTDLRAGERVSKRKSESSPIFWGRSDTQAVPITPVTEVIEVIG